MLWLATLVGAVAGGAIASIPGALLGALLGHLLDRKLALRSFAHLRQRLFASRASMDDEELLFTLLGRLAKSEGRVLDSHIRLARDEMQRLRLDDRALRAAMNAFSHGKQIRTKTLRAPLQALQGRPERGEALLRACWRMAWADGRAGTTEIALIEQWGLWLGWRRPALAALAREYQPKRQEAALAGGQYQAALRLLGVSADASLSEVKRNYRRLLSRHHPDKLAGSGASAEQVRAATEKTSELHRAYEMLCKHLQR